MLVLSFKIYSFSSFSPFFFSFVTWLEGLSLGWWPFYELWPWSNEKHIIAGICTNIEFIVRSPLSCRDVLERNFLATSHRFTHNFGKQFLFLFLVNRKQFLGLTRAFFSSSSFFFFFVFMFSFFLFLFVFVLVGWGGGAYS